MWLHKKRITLKIFLDSDVRFVNHDLVIALQMTASTTTRSRSVAAGQQSCRTATVRSI
jgi:hypothetical protein